MPEQATVPAQTPALWRNGFRPFYLLASAFAALSVALWALQLAGVLVRPYLAGALWHAHELLFGFTLAVVVGFLFTAGRNWSNRPTPSGMSLAAFAALWVAARVLVLTPFGWPRRWSTRPFRWPPRWRSRFPSWPRATGATTSSSPCSC